MNPQNTPNTVFDATVSVLHPHQRVQHLRITSTVTSTPEAEIWYRIESEQWPKAIAEMIPIDINQQEVILPPIKTDCAVTIQMGVLEKNPITDKKKPAPFWFAPPRKKPVLNYTSLPKRATVIMAGLNLLVAILVFCLYFVPENEVLWAKKDRVVETAPAPANETSASQEVTADPRDPTYNPYATPAPTETLTQPEEVIVKRKRFRPLGEDFGITMYFIGSLLFTALTGLGWGLELLHGRFLEPQEVEISSFSTSGGWAGDGEIGKEIKSHFLWDLIKAIVVMIFPRLDAAQRAVKGLKKQQ